MLMDFMDNVTCRRKVIKDKGEFMFSYLCYRCSNEKRNVVFLTLNYVEKI